MKEKNSAVVVVGFSGIGMYRCFPFFPFHIPTYIYNILGKSTELNYILMMLLRRMGEVGWPSTVLFRLPGDPVVEFTLDPSSSQQCIVREHEGTETLDGVYECSENYGKKEAVMLMDLGEDETNPTCHIPCYITVHSEDAIEVTKTISKTQNSQYLLSDPPSLTQLKLQALALKQYSLTQPAPGSFLDGSLEEVLAKVETRARLIGTLPRYIFCGELYYEDQLHVVNYHAFEFSMLSVYELDRNAMPYIASFIKPNMIPKYSASDADGDPAYEFRFLSDHCARVIAKSIIKLNDKRLNVLPDHHLDYQLAEIIMISTLFKDVSDTYTREAWEVYTDPGNTTKLTKRHRLVKKEEDAFKSGVAIPWATHTVLFESIHYEGDVKLLQESSLYRSAFISHKVPFGQCFMVSHQQRTVWFFQSTCGDVKDHPLPICIIRNVMNKLGMFTDTGKEYELVIVIFADWSRRITHGSKVAASSPAGGVTGSETTPNPKRPRRDTPSEPVPLTPEDADIMSRVKTWIVRHCYYPQLPKFELKGA